MQLRVLALVFAIWPVWALSQDQILSSPVLTIDTEELYQASVFGARLRSSLDQESQALAAENRLIEAELVAEERLLTQERKLLSPEAFREKAKAFDEKVVTLRATQDEKTRSLFEEREALEQQFLQTVLPVLAQIIRERGAVVVLEERTVFLAAEQIDITEAAIARIDAQFASSQEPAAAPE